MPNGVLVYELYFAQRSKERQSEKDRWPEQGGSFGNFIRKLGPLSYQGVDFIFHE